MKHGLRSAIIGLLVLSPAIVSARARSGKIDPGAPRHAPVFARQNPALVQ